MKSEKLTIVTVVYLEELPLLRLQARSIRRWFRSADIEKIVVCINQREVSRTIHSLEALLSEYGELASKVEIKTGDDIFSHKGEILAPLLIYRKFLARNLSRIVRPRTGWRANDGWNIQQAFKLAIARHVTSRYILILDAKNIFIKDVAFSDFVASDGRARAGFSRSNRFNAKWFPGSARVLGLKERHHPDLFLKFLTPFCYERTLVVELLDFLEQQKVPVEYIFSTPGNKATEFMLISAWTSCKGKSVDTVFAGNLLRSYTVFSGMDMTLAKRIFQEAVDEGGKCIGLHSKSIDALISEHESLIVRLLIDGEIVESAAEATDILGSSHAAKT